MTLSRSRRRSLSMETVRATVSMMRPRYLSLRHGPVRFFLLTRSPSQLKTDSAVSMSAAHCSAVAAAKMASSTYMLQFSPMAVRN